MVCRQELQRIAADQIESAVAHVGDGENRPDQPGRHDRGAHAGVFDMTRRLLMHLVIGQPDGARQPVGG